METPCRASIFRGMGRSRRPHLPGATFHLTARLQLREPLFDDDVKSGIVGYLRDHVAASDFDVFAYAIMNNHLHLVVRQNWAPLSSLMQPLLRRIALLIQRRYDRQGHVFEQRFRHRICADPEYLRNAIVYTHLNPLRAGLCARLDEYIWTSHAAWLGRIEAADSRCEPLETEVVLPIFASAPDRTRSDLIADYVAFMEWRIRLDRWLAKLPPSGGNGCSPPPPPVTAGNAFWRRYLVPPTEHFTDAHVSGEVVSSAIGAPRPDLLSIARSVVACAERPLELDTVRSRWGGATYAKARRAIAGRAFLVGYRNSQIAAFLRVSPSAIAAVRAEQRKRMLLATRKAA